MITDILFGETHESNNSSSLPADSFIVAGGGGEALNTFVLTHFGPGEFVSTLKQTK